MATRETYKVNRFSELNKLSLQIGLLFLSLTITMFVLYYHYHDSDKF